MSRRTMTRAPASLSEDLDPNICTVFLATARAGPTLQVPLPVAHFAKFTRFSNAMNFGSDRSGSKM
ncbi:hypothetical protein BH11GEM2_BH11GEM2_15620 [soil metagenome]